MYSSTVQYILPIDCLIVPSQVLLHSLPSLWIVGWGWLGGWGVGGLGTGGLGTGDWGRGVYLTGLSHQTKSAKKEMSGVVEIYLPTGSLDPGFICFRGVRTMLSHAKTRC